MSQPNIFEHATKELSFDAFLLWLFSWSKEKYKNVNPDLYKCSHDLLKLLVPNIKNLKLVKVHKQLYRADVVVELGNDIIIIENKVGSFHSIEQILEYEKNIRNDKDNKLVEHKNKNIHSILILFDNNDCNLNYEELQKVKVIRRKEILEILKPYNQSHPFVCDFYNHYEEKEKDFQSWSSTSFEKLSSAGFEGFCFALKEYFLKDKIKFIYGYVRSFIGGYWEIKLNDKEIIYLQIQNKNNLIRLVLRASNDDRQGTFRKKIINSKIFDESKILNSHYNAETQQFYTHDDFIILDENNSIDCLKTYDNLTIITKDIQTKLNILKDD